jgi:erythronate-4-phosphate dehydrogenase
VAEYVLAALTVMAERGGYGVTERVLGIVGCGNVGGRLARMAEAVGVRVLQNDPPLARQTGDPRYLPLDALVQAHAVTFHVPLDKQGPDATFHMINTRLIGRLKHGVTIINSSRGGVAETAALKQGVDGGRIAALVLDVWEGEPNLDLDLLHRTDLATPHIAGYSYDGKVNGTRMVLEALCRHFGVERTWDSSPLMPSAATPRVCIPAGATLEEALRRAIAAAYDIEADDRRLRAIAQQSPDRRAKHFNTLRKEYPVRREFPETTAELVEPTEGVAEALRALDFGIDVQGGI